MPTGRVHHTTHEATIAAPAGVVYGLLADAARWPLYFPPTVHVEQQESDGTRERLTLWATTNDQVTSWTSRRALDAGRRRIEFHQEASAAPVASMAGTWIVEPRGTSCRLVLLHDFTVTGDNAGDTAQVERATDTNSRAELDNLKQLAEGWENLDDLVMSFEDSVRINGPADPVYSFLHRVQHWPQLVPHVTRLDLTEPEPNVQVMAMDTLTADGNAHTTESVRICFPDARRIVYKQTATPLLMSAHTGEWTITEDATGVTATSRHSVVLREENITRVLGPEADVADCRRYVREALGRNSSATLNLAKAYAESHTATA
ncbi:aromatase/cyclase [Streptomyces sp. NPDC059851]|uniref:aromatase/cyclase n=1 Tax=Streptomyces sp. NPDC059851 TaxID=3346971 RepID=UPI003654955F